VPQRVTVGIEQARASAEQTPRWRGLTRSFAVSALVLAACSKSGGANVEAGTPPPAEAPRGSARTAGSEAEPVVPSSSLATAETAREGGISEALVPGSARPSLRRGVRLSHGITWYEDDPEAAFAAARASGKRVVVDLWAPWCHTCLSMQSVVLTADQLPAMSDRFIWLAIDTEREDNAGLLERLPVSVWPTFYVVDAGPADATRVEIRGRWLGAASAAQFARFLTESDAGPASAGPSASDEPVSALAAADGLAAQGRNAEAAAAYAALLARVPREWPRRPETLVAQMTALWKARDIDTCLRVAEASIDETGDSASAVDFSHYALECASQAPANGRGAAVREAVTRRLEPLCKLGTRELSPDDRADACDKLAAARTAAGDADGARQATMARLAVLERAAFGKTSEQALTYDWARTDALLQLGRAEEALAIASERERELPQNYNPPHYRAKSFKALGRWTEGLAAIERALSLAYGPRKIGLLTLKADLLLGAGRQADAQSTLREQLVQYRALPAGQRQPAAEARVEQRLKSLEAPATAH